MSIEGRVVDREFGLQTGRDTQVFSYGRPDEGASWVGPGRRRERRMMRPCNRAEGGVGKRLKRKMGEQRGMCVFIDVESGGWPVHAPCPKRRPPFPGGQTARLR
jgi:hypothetical protein